MTTSTQIVVQRRWNYCNLLHDVGMSYGDYLEKFTSLLFLEMAHERSRPPYSQLSRIAAGYDWPSLLARQGDELETHSG
jgi:type I restriction enzyme M protein